MVFGLLAEAGAAGSMSPNPRHKLAAVMEIALRFIAFLLFASDFRNDMVEVQPHMGGQEYCG
jgi:hypothetical protein